MAIQTDSDELYRRHEREWAQLRNAVEANENRQTPDEQVSGEPSFDDKTSAQG